jgi:hypothetical protein
MATLEGPWAEWGAPMKMVAEYLEHAVQFECVAAEATDPEFKEALLVQARAYRRLAEQCVKVVGRPPEVSGPRVVGKRDGCAPT